MGGASPSSESELPRNLDKSIPLGMIVRIVSGLNTLSLVLMCKIKDGIDGTTLLVENHLNKLRD